MTKWLSDSFLGTPSDLLDLPLPPKDIFVLFLELVSESLRMFTAWYTFYVSIKWIESKRSCEMGVVKNKTDNEKLKKLHQRKIFYLAGRPRGLGGWWELWSSSEGRVASSISNFTRTEEPPNAEKEGVTGKSGRQRSRRKWEKMWWTRADSLKPNTQPETQNNKKTRGFESSSVSSQQRWLACVKQVHHIS